MKTQSFIVPTGTDPMADGTSWTWVRKKVDLEIPEEALQRRRYPAWLGEPEFDRKGLYIWATRGNDAQVCRFVHTGISVRGMSTVAHRTKAHLRAQFLFTDRIHHIEWIDRFGTLGPNLREKEESRDAALRDFLGRLEIIYLFPEDDRANSQIRCLEGIISTAAAYLLDYHPVRIGDSGWETTNTLSKTSGWAVNPVAAESLAEELNRCLGMEVLPTRSRQIPAS